MNEATQAAIARAQAEHRSLWRISSTCFSHFASDVTLEPLEPFVGSPDASKYAPIKTGDFVARELAAIKLASGSEDTIAAL